MADNTLEMEIDLTQIEKLSKDMINVADKGMLYTTEYLLGETVKEAPVNEGRLQGSFDMGKVEKMAYFVGSNVGYRWWVHEGTGIYGPHNEEITPVQAKFLHFEINGREVFTKSVKGQEPNRYYDRAIENTEKRVDMFIQKAVREYI